MSHGAESGYRMTSISRRFSYLLIGIVTILLMVFSAIVVSYHIRVIDADLNTRLENAISFAKKSLPTPLWNLDYDVVSDVVDALFLNMTVLNGMPTAVVPEPTSGMPFCVGSLALLAARRKRSA